jgi:hypothetical protein
VPQGYGAVSSNRFRLDLAGPGGAGQSFEFSLEDHLLLTDPPGYLPLPGPSVNRTLELEESWNSGKRVVNRLEVDRLNFGGTRGPWEWRAGRQAIGFGRIVLFSPLDLIAPFPPDALDVDVRPGVDALRVVRHSGLAGQLGGTVVFGDSSRHHSYLATVTDNVRQIDILALGGWLRDRPVLGLGLAGSLGPLGLKGEIAGYRGTRAGQPGGDAHSHFAIGAVEAWYRFDAGPVLLAEYLFNGAGTGDPARYPAIAASAAVREGLSFLAGRHYLLLGPSWEVHPLVTLTGLMILNLEDRSWLLRPLLDFSLADNLSLQAFWTFTQGREPAFQAPSPLPQVRSEFGSFGDSGGLFLKYFF